MTKIVKNPVARQGLQYLNTAEDFSSNFVDTTGDTIRKPLDTFDSVQHIVAPSTWTNDTTFVKPGYYSVTGDVLNVISDFFYIGKDTKFTDIYFDFSTIMSVGTNRRWEYSVTEYETAVVTGSVAATVLTVTEVTSGELFMGDNITDGATLNATITGFTTGTGGVGTYVISPTSGTIGSTTITARGTWNNLPITTDGTNQWANDGVVNFNAPADWITKSVVGAVTYNGYWVRVGTVSGAFTTEPTLQLALPETCELLTGEILTDTTFDTGATNWAVTGGWSYTTGDYTFTWTSGTTTGTLTQASADFLNPAKPNTWYRFRYQVGVVGAATTNAWIGPEFAEGNTSFQITSTTEIDVFFKTNSNPGDFVIYTTATAASGLVLNGVSLTELKDGNIANTGLYTGGGSTGIKVLNTGSVGIGTVVPGKLLSVGANLWQSDVNGIQWNNNAQTTTNGLTGTSVSSQSFQGSSYKKFVVYLTNFTSAGTVLTFPTAFTKTPYVYGDAAAVAIAVTTSTNVTLTSVGAVAGNIFVEGY